MRQSTRMNLKAPHCTAPLHQRSPGTSSCLALLLSRSAPSMSNQTWRQACRRGIYAASTWAEKSQGGAHAAQGEAQRHALHRVQHHQQRHVHPLAARRQHLPRPRKESLPSVASDVRGEVVAMSSPGRTHEQARQQGDQIHHLRGNAPAIQAGPPAAFLRCLC